MDLTLNLRNHYLFADRYNWFLGVSYTKGLNSSQVLQKKEENSNSISRNDWQVIIHFKT